MQQTILSLLSVVVGFALATFKDSWQRRRRRETHWAALRAELEFCRRQAETFLRDGVAAPLYRLPTTAYMRAFPALLADAAASEADVDALMQFFTEVETFNRGLDLAQAARAHNSETALQEEHQRNHLKARRLIHPQGGETNFYTAANQAIARHL
jgi:hypothetical protein